MSNLREVAGPTRRELPGKIPKRQRPCRYVLASGFWRVPAILAAAAQAPKDSSGVRKSARKGLYFQKIGGSSGRPGRLLFLHRQ